MNKRIFSSLLSGAFLLLSLAFLGCEKDDMKGEQNILETARGNAELSILVEALEAADLDNVLADDGPFTVFAPNNAAFQQFLVDNSLNSLEEVPQDLLRSVLLYHVIGASVPAASLNPPVYTSTASPVSFGSDLTATLYGANDNGAVTVNGNVNVITGDLSATNGRIHIVDRVIDLPTVVTFALADPRLSNLVAALTRADLSTDFVEVLTGEGPFTVFAPTNEAFEQLIAGNPSWNTLDDIPTATLEEVLRYHVANGNVRSADLQNGQQINTLATGESFTIDLSDPGAPSITDASGGSSSIIFVDVQGINGVVHVVDRVLVPSL